MNGVGSLRYSLRHVEYVKYHEISQTFLLDVTIARSATRSVFFAQGSIQCLVMPFFSPKSQAKAVYFQDVSSGSSETKESTLSWGRSTAPWLLTYNVKFFLKHVDICLSAVVIFLFAGNRKWTDISLSWIFVVIHCSCDIRKGALAKRSDNFNDLRSVAVGVHHSMSRVENIFIAFRSLAVLSLSVDSTD